MLSREWAVSQTTDTQKLIDMVIISAPKRIKMEVKQDCEGSGGSIGCCLQFR